MTKSDLLETIGVIFAGAVSSFLLGGCFGDGILVAEWVDYFNQGSGATSLLGTVTIGIGLCGAPIANLSVKRFGFRKVYFAASVMFATFIALTSFVNNLYFAIALRVFAACGYAVHINASGPYLLNRFKNISSLVQAIRTTAVACGGLLFPFIINYCLNVYGWRGCCLILGGIALQQCPISLSFRNWSSVRPTRDTELQKIDNSINGETKTPTEPTVKSFKDMYQLDLFKRSIFIVFIIHSVIANLGISIIFVHIVGGSRDLYQLPIEQARFTLSALSLANMIGLFIISLSTKFPRVDPLTLYLILNALLGVQVVIFPCFTGYAAALAISTSIGFLLAGYGSLLLISLIELFGSEYSFMSFAYSRFFCGIGYVVGAPLAGWIYDATKNYANSFYFCGGLMILSSLMMLPHWIKHFKGLGRKSSVDQPLEQK